MNRIILMLALCALSFSSAYSLEPLNVSIINTNAGPHNLTVEVNNYDGGVANVFTENFNGLTPNSSGVISFTLGVGSAAWTGIAASSVNSYYVIDVKIGTLYAQYRLDELIRLQAQSGVTDKDGNIIPGENDASTLGTDTQRWKDVYVGPASFHIGAPGDEASISYTTGSNTLNLVSDVTQVSANLLVTDNVAIGGTVVVDGNTTLGNSNQNDSHTINGKVSLENNSNNVNNPALYLSNRNNDNTSYALVVDEGHIKPSTDNNTTTINNGDPITIGNKTIIRLKSDSGNDISGNVLSDGTYKGQIIYLLNENGGKIDLDDTNIAGNAEINQRSAAQFIWNGSNWIMMNR